jgi:hypothetical protein
VQPRFDELLNQFRDEVILRLHKEFAKGIGAFFHRGVDRGIFDCPKEVPEFSKTYRISLSPRAARKKIFSPLF